MARLIDAHPDFDPRAWLADHPPMDAFGALVFQVAGQQLSVASTRAILRRLQERFGGRFPTPKEMLALAPEELHRSGFSRRKVETLRELAQRFHDGRIDRNVLEKLSDDEVEARLTQIRGVGPWTVHGFLIIALAREDVVLPGDLALRKAIQRIYRLRHRPSPKEVLRIAEPWRPYRSLATSYLFQAAFDPTS